MPGFDGDPNPPPLRGPAIVRVELHSTYHLRESTDRASFLRRVVSEGPPAHKPRRYPSLGAVRNASIGVFEPTPHATEAGGSRTLIRVSAERK